MMKACILAALAVISLRSFIATCETSHYDWTHPPRICRQHCADGEVWSRQAKMCVMSCPAAGCL